MSQCDKCGASVESSEEYEFAGQSLCEDCYLELKIKPVTCDPWAVHSARNTKGQTPQLTDIQRRIFELIKADGPLDAAEILHRLGISETEFQNNFATLRHMELARGFKDGEKVRYTLF